MILIGDVGGTKVTLAWASGSADAPQISGLKRFESAAYPGLEPLLVDFLSESGTRPQATCLGVAGPIVHGDATLPNLGWTLNRARMSQNLDLGPTRFLNDLEALAHGALILPPEGLRSLHPGVPGSGTHRVVVAPGTGLGEALIIQGAEGPVVVATEGGHTELGPRDPQQDRLVAFLRAEYGHVSAERAISGPGLNALYRFLAADGVAGDPELLEATQAAPRHAEAIGQAALQGACPRAEEAVSLFFNLLGAETSNSVLKAMGLGGVFLGGTLIPALLNDQYFAAFMAGYLDVGRYSALVAKAPISLITDPMTHLLGAAKVGLKAHPSHQES